MIGIDRQTGKVIRDEAYLRDRLQSCLSMRRGTHPMARRKGSAIPSLIDRPMNKTTLFELQVAAIEALSDVHNGLSDFAVKQIKVLPVVTPGTLNFMIIYAVDGITKTLTGIEVSR